MTERFELEQHIMKCWNITDELGSLIAAYDDLSEDQRLNILLGLKDLYEVKFNQCFASFEKCIHEKSI
jgi:hypothetical protein